MLSRVGRAGWRPLLSAVLVRRGYAWKCYPDLPFDPVDFPPQRIRNFCIIAHIDHGKTTLSDALLTATGTLPEGEAHALYLDKLQVERERGITVKAQTASMRYEHRGATYLLNLIDTPGHVDFTYEVSRSMHACEGAVLLVDAAQGAQAQTTANLELARNNRLTIVPAITKVDMERANVAEVQDELQILLDVERDAIVLTSARQRVGIDALLRAVCERIPPPAVALDGPTRLLLFDAWPNAKSQHITCLVSVKQGCLRRGDQVMSYATGQKYTAGDIGLMYPEPASCSVLYAGQVGFLELGMTSKKEALIGDTLFLPSQTPLRDVVPFPGFRSPTPKVYASMYPVNPANFPALRQAVDKLGCNDASVQIESESSDALGNGLRCGFLGVLHLNIYCERLRQEFGEEVIITPPSVLFQGVRPDGSVLPIRTPADWVEWPTVTEHREPMVLVELVAPGEYRGDLMHLCQDRRGRQLDLAFLSQGRCSLKYMMPLVEIIQTFYETVKRISSGYATVEYEDAGYEKADLVKVDVRLNGHLVDCMSQITHKSKAERYARAVVGCLRGVVPRQLVDIAIQASIRKRVIARETIKQLRKDVTAKCYGGDIGRKRKLLDRQKEGKKKMRAVWEVQVPHEAFTEVMKLDR